MRYDEEIYIVIVYRKKKTKAHLLAYSNCKEEHDLEKETQNLFSEGFWFYFTVQWNQGRLKGVWFSQSFHNSQAFHFG